MKLMKLSGVPAIAGSLLLAGVVAAAPAVAVTFTEISPVRSIDPYSDSGSVEAFTIDGDTLYVASYDVIKVFPRTASGLATPQRVITGANTQLESVSDLAVGADGRLYVSDWNGFVLVFAADADGDVAPVQSIKGDNVDLGYTSSVAVGPDGSIYVGDYDGQVHVWSRTATGDVAPNRTLEGPDGKLDEPEDLLFDKKGDLLVSDYSDDAIHVFDAAASGKAAPIRSFWAPEEFDCNYRMAMDSSENVYVNTCYDNIFVFGRGASGVTTPLKTIRPAGGKSVWTLALDSDRNFYVGNNDDYVVDVFSPQIPFAKPAPATAVAVAGKAKDVKRTASWKASADDGGAPVTYKVEVKQGGTTLLSTTTASTSLTVGREILKKGSHQVTVTATNRAGAAAAATASFGVAQIKPGRVQEVSVKGGKAAAKRTVRWAKPAWDGGAKVRSYRVVVKQGKAVLVNETVKAKKRKLKVLKADLAGGKHKVLVRAKNKKGFGKPGKATFTVKK